MSCLFSKPTPNLMFNSISMCGEYCGKRQRKEVEEAFIDNLNSIVHLAFCYVYDLNEDQWIRSEIIISNMNTTT